MPKVRAWFCFGLETVIVIHILQGYFTAWHWLEQYARPSDTEVTVDDTECNDSQEYRHNKTKHHKTTYIETKR